MKYLISKVRQWTRQRRAQRVSITWARERARRGAGYLDDVAPGWYRGVDPATLELASGGACVLGQLHGDFRVGLVRARLLNVSSAPRASLSPVAFGFQCVQRVDPAVQNADYDHLTQAWTEAVRQRQARERRGSESASPVRAGSRPPRTRQAAAPSSLDSVSS